MNFAKDGRPNVVTTKLINNTAIIEKITNPKVNCGNSGFLRLPIIGSSYSSFTRQDHVRQIAFNYNFFISLL